MSEPSPTAAPPRGGPPLTFWIVVGLACLSSLLVGADIESYLGGSEPTCIVSFSFFWTACLVYTWQIALPAWLGFLGAIGVFAFLARLVPGRTRRVTLLFRVLAAAAGLAIAVGSLFDSVPVVGPLGRAAGQAYVRFLDNLQQNQRQQEAISCLKLARDLGDDVTLWDFKSTPVIDDASRKINGFDVDFRLTAPRPGTVTVNTTLSFPGHDGDLSSPVPATVQLAPQQATHIRMRVTRRYFSPIWPDDQPVLLKGEVELRWTTPAPAGQLRRTVISYPYRKGDAPPPEAYCSDAVVYVLFSRELITAPYLSADFATEAVPESAIPTPLVEYTDNP